MHAPSSKLHLAPHLTAVHVVGRRLRTMHGIYGMHGAAVTTTNGDHYQRYCLPGASPGGDAQERSLIGVVVNPKVDAYIRRSESWPQEMADLRPILLSCGLTEEIKWGKPCYSHEGRNIVILQEMKQFLALMFFKGALLDDPEGVLEEQGPNSRSARRIRFTSVEDVARLTDTVKAYIDEAIDVEDAGLELGPGPELELVEELQTRLERDPVLKAAFEAQRPGVQISPTRPRQTCRSQAVFGLRSDVLKSRADHR